MRTENAEGEREREIVEGTMSFSSSTSKKKSEFLAVFSVRRVRGSPSRLGANYVSAKRGSVHVPCLFSSPLRG